MACGRSAERKFWSSPELLEMLLVGFLDPHSIVNLARVHTLALETLQRASVWKTVIDKDLDPNEDGWREEDGRWKTDDGRGEEEFFDFHQDKIEDLASIMDLVKSDEIKKHLVKLICERFSSGEDGTGEPIVQMTFSCSHKKHTVSELGFLLLEKLKLGEVDEINTFLEDEKLLLALSRRVSSQQGLVNLLLSHTVRVKTAEGAEAFSRIAERCKNLQVGFLEVAGDIGSRTL